jgi:arsenate reductase
MSVTFYWYPKCGTCRNAKKWLEAQGIMANAIDLFQTPPAEAELARLVELSGLDVQKFFNTSGEVYKEMKLKEQLPQMSREEKIRLLSSNGRLIKRPIMTDGAKVTVGYKEDEYRKVWG